VSRSALLAAAGDAEIVLSWGHPNGLAFGTSAEAEANLGFWLDFAKKLGSRLVRIVVGGPALRGAEPVGVQIARTIDPLKRVATRAAKLDLALAVENHGDLTTVELAHLLTMADQPHVGICLDTANVLRLGEDLDRVCEEVGELTRMIHLKDIEPPAQAADPIAGPCSVRYGEGAVPLEPALDALSTPIDAGAPVLLEIGQVRPGDDELELLATGMSWLHARAAA
jgi:sugar phosphate isomerase/epimerase